MSDIKNNNINKNKIKVTKSTPGGNNINCCVNMSASVVNASTSNFNYFCFQ